MSTAIPLQGESSKIELDFGINLEAPGLYGTVHRIDPGETSSSRFSSEIDHAYFDGAFDEMGMETLAIFEFEVERDEVLEESGTRSDDLVAQTEEGEPASLLTLQSPGENHDSVIFYTDETGVSRWLFPVETEEMDVQAFHLPRAQGEVDQGSDAAGQHRGIITKVLHHSIRVLTWVTDAAMKKVVPALIKAADRKGYGFLSVEPGKYSPDINWQGLAGKRTLLMIHGTFGHADKAFDGLVQNESRMREIYNHYEGRIISFDHPTLRHTPEQNVKELLTILHRDAPEIPLEFDIMTRSRGALVARELIEHADLYNFARRPINFRKTVFVAPPNLGTLLVSPKHLRTFLDRYTKLISVLPDHLITIVMQSVLGLVKILAGGVREVPGLAAIRPDGPFLKHLNADEKSHQAQYFSLGADYIPEKKGFLARMGGKITDKVVDSVFGDDPNDWILPTRGFFENDTNSTGFPITKKRFFTKENSINHFTYFEHQPVHDQITEWLLEKDQQPS